MYNFIDVKPKHTKQVWTPLKKPPHPRSVHILSDDALLVLATIREDHRKKLEDQQRRCQMSKRGKSYYTRIYAQSFKMEKVDGDQHNSPNHTEVIPDRTGNQEQPRRESLFSGDSSGNTQKYPTLAISLRAEEVEESLISDKNPKDAIKGHSTCRSNINNEEVPGEGSLGQEQPHMEFQNFWIGSGNKRKAPSTMAMKAVSSENRSQLAIQFQHQNQYDIKDHHCEMKVIDNYRKLMQEKCSNNDACEPTIRNDHLLAKPSADPRLLPLSQSMIGNVVQGSRVSNKARCKVSRAQTGEDVTAVKNSQHTLPSLQNVIQGTSKEAGTSLVPPTLPSSRSLPSSEDVEQLDGCVTSSPFKTEPLLQHTAAFPSEKTCTLSFSHGSTNSSKSYHPIHAVRSLTSPEDVERRGNHRSVGGRKTHPGVIKTTASPCNLYSEDKICSAPSQLEKHEYEGLKITSTKLSALDMNILPTHVDINDSKHQHYRASKSAIKRENACMRSQSISEIAKAAKRKVVPAFHPKTTGSREKLKKMPDALVQMSIDQVMGSSSLREASIPARIITSMLPLELTELHETLSQSDEILMMLTYTDGSTQLREPNETKKSASATTHMDGAAKSVLVAVQQKTAQKEYVFVSFPLSGPGKENKSEETRKVLIDILQSKSRTICFDAQELMHAIIINYRLDPQLGCNKWMIMDPKIACWLLDPDNPPVTFSEILKTFVAGKFHLSSNNHLMDLKLLGPVMEHLTNNLRRKNLWELFINLEVPLIPILAGMEVQGIQVDQKKLISYSNILKDELKAVERQCYKEAGHPFQITSHIQLRQVLFDELKLDKLCPGQKLQRTNVQNLKSTSEAVLHKLKSLHPLPELVLNHRQLVKLKSTYIDGLSDYVSGGYVHTSWEQTSAASGRLQSANPNIQNIPKQPFKLHKVTDGSVADGPTLWMREPFYPQDGWSFIAADFQSIELRILAHLSQDPVLLKVFNDAGSTDIFVQLTCEWLGVSPDDVKTTDRERTKRIVYSVVYGVGAERLAETLNDTKENAKAFTKSFLGKFKGVNSFAQRCISECQRHGHVRTIFHRHRLISNINSLKFHARSHAERQAVNFVIQGSAADICKLAMINIMKVLSERNSIRARLLVQIHDELLFEVHDEDIDEVKGILKSVMEAAPTLGDSTCRLKVPLPVSLSIGKNWGHLKQV
nr:DNA polymerase nu-like [Lytechinus pictus]